MGEIRKSKYTKDGVLNLLKERILSGRIRAGEKLNETGLASELQISRVPVREALQRLEELGLVMTAPRKGKFVVNLTVEEVQKINSIRLIFEVEALALCRRNLGSSAKLTLSGLADKMESDETIDHNEVSRLDLEFHRTIWSQSGNEYLEKALTMITTPLFAHRAVSHQNSRVKRSILRHHRVLFEYVIGNSRRTPGEIMMEHLSMGYPHPERFSSLALQQQSGSYLSR